MKQIIPSEQKSQTLSHIIVVAAGMGMLALLIYFQELWGWLQTILGVITPFLLGIGLAFLQVPIVHRVEGALKKYVFKKKPRPRLGRALGATVSLLAVLAMLAAFIGVMLPQLIDSIKQLVSYISAFISSNVDQLNQLLLQWDFITFEGEDLIIAWDKILAETSDYIAFVVDNVMAISSTIYTVVFQLFVGLITAFYLLMDKERFCNQSKKICYATMRRETCESLIYWTRHASHIFAGFISGKILDSIIIGVMCYLGMLLFKMEYALLISCIIAVTNIIPFFGPFIGWAPCALILLLVNPMSALWFSLYVLFLQQLDGNVIGPHILGDYVGVSALSIMIAIVIGGGLFGFVGMLVSVPVYALGYAFFRALIYDRLRKRDMPVQTDEYVDAPECFHSDDVQTEPEVKA